MTSNVCRMAGFQQSSIAMGLSSKFSQEKQLSLRMKVIAAVPNAGPFQPDTGASEQSIDTSRSDLSKRREEERLAEWFRKQRPPKPIGVNEKGNPIYRRRQAGYAVQLPDGLDENAERELLEKFQARIAAKTKAAAQEAGSSQPDTGSSKESIDTSRSDLRKRSEEEDEERIAKRLQEDKAAAKPIGVNEHGRPIYRRRPSGYAIWIPDGMDENARRELLGESAGRNADAKAAAPQAGSSQPETGISKQDMDDEQWAEYEKKREKEEKERVDKWFDEKIAAAKPIGYREDGRPIYRRRPKGSVEFREGTFVDEHGRLKFRARYAESNLQEGSSENATANSESDPADGAEPSERVE